MAKRLQEWLPEDHPAHVLSEIVDELDLSSVTGADDDAGRASPPTDPGMLVKLLLYAYALGIFSSREIARQYEENIAFQVLMAGTPPDFRALSAFRQRHLSALPAVFFQILTCCRHIGLEKLGSLSLKETATPSRLSKPKGKGARRKPGVAGGLEAQIKELLARAEEADAAEDLRYGQDQRGDEIPRALLGRESRLQAIRSALAAPQDEFPGMEPGSLAQAGRPRKVAGPRDEPVGAGPTNGKEDVGDATSAVGEEQREAGMPAEPAPPAARPEEPAEPEEARITLSPVASDVLGPAEASSADNGQPLEGARADMDSVSQLPASTVESEEIVQVPVEALPDIPSDAPINGQDEPGPGLASPPPITRALRTEILPPPITRVLKDRATRVRMPEHAKVLLQLREIRLVDLSVSGALIEHSMPVRIGSLYRIAIPVEGHQIQVSARAVRAYASHFIQGENGEKTVVYRTGMEFVKLERDAAKRLAAYIDRLLAEEQGVG
jgi:transposase